MKNIIIDGIEYNITPIIKKEKDYEILSFIGKNATEPLRILNSITKLYKHAYVDATKELTESFLLADHSYNIHSVKRLSDSQIFTIGDKVGTPGNIYPIAKFKISDTENTILVSSYYENGRSGSYNTRLKNVIKSKTPLFTTEDGVDIFESDTYYELITPDFHNKPCIWNILPNETRGNINYDQEGNRRNGRIWFSTKEKAEEYILLNKPCLSILEIHKLLLSAGVGLSGKKEKELKDLVKSKN